MPDLPPLAQIVAEIEQIERSLAPAFERAKDNIELLKGTAAAAAIAFWKAGFVAGCKSVAVQNSSS